MVVEARKVERPEVVSKDLAVLRVELDDERPCILQRLRDDRRMAWLRPAHELKRLLHSRSLRMLINRPSYANDDTVTC